MHRFAPALRRVARDLDLPRDTRAGILLEMAADLEAVYAHHRAQGAAEAEAVRRAEETVLGSSDATARLVRLHRDSWRGWATYFGAQLLQGTDVVPLLLGVAPACAIAVAVSLRVLLRSPTPLALLMLAAGSALVIVAIAEALRLVRGARARATRLEAVLLLSAVVPAVGVLALLLGIRATSVLYAAAATDGAAHATVAAMLVRDGATFVLGACMGIAGAFAWLVLLSRATLQAIREVDDILAGRTRPPVGMRARGIIPLVKGWRT